LEPTVWQDPVPSQPFEEPFFDTSDPFTQQPEASTSTAATEPEAEKIRGVPRFNVFQGRDSKPPYSYAALIAQAIYHSPKQALSLADIYAFIEAQYPWYASSQASMKSWQNSIRHNLSLKAVFVKTDREAGAPGKGSIWKMDAAGMELFNGIEFRDASGGKKVGLKKAAKKSAGKVELAPVASKSQPAKSNLQEVDHNVTPPRRSTVDLLNEGVLTRSQQKKLHPVEAPPQPSPMEATLQTLSFVTSPTAKICLAKHQYQPERPPFTFAAMCAQAIVQHATMSPTLNEIYGWIMEKYPHFKPEAKGWQVRHLDLRAGLP
jgi:hypothetical protein